MPDDPRSDLRRWVKQRIDAGKREELIMSFPMEVRAFDPKTGSELWRCTGLNPLVYGSAFAGGVTVVAMGGFSGNSLAVKAGGTGDVTSKRLWHQVRAKGGIDERMLSILPPVLSPNSVPRS